MRFAYLALIASTPAVAQTSPEIVVTGRRPPGSVVGDVPAEVVLSPADVRSYGVSSVSDLLTELSPQTRSGAGGAPVVLLDGKRPRLEITTARGLRHGMSYDPTRRAQLEALDAALADAIEQWDAPA